jgi:hypothetical protein
VRLAAAGITRMLDHAPLDEVDNSCAAVALTRGLSGGRTEGALSYRCGSLGDEAHVDGSSCVSSALGRV